MIRSPSSPHPVVYALPHTSTVRSELYFHYNPRCNSRRYDAVFLCPSHNQGLFANNINQARDTSRKAKNTFHRTGSEQSRNPATGHPQTVPDIISGIVFIHGCQTASDGNSLAELA